MSTTPLPLTAPLSNVPSIVLFPDAASYPSMMLRIPPSKTFSDEDLFELTRLNKHLRIERTSHGEVTITPPTGFDGGNRNLNIAVQFGAWCLADGTGAGGDSSTGYLLPNGAMRSPDASWVRNSKLASFTSDDRKKFLPICPDFVLELRSETDTIRYLQEKMEEYISCGAELGWLIDPIEKAVYVYRPKVGVEILNKPETLSGEPVLRNFVLDLRTIL